jgi:hypothetical protein
MASVEGKLFRCGVTGITLNSLGRSYLKVIVKKIYRQGKADTQQTILTNASDIFELKIRNYEEKEFPLEIDDKTIDETLQEAISAGMNSPISYECMVLLKISAMTHILLAKYTAVQVMNQFNVDAAGANGGPPSDVASANESGAMSVDPSSSDSASIAGANGGPPSDVSTKTSEAMSLDSVPLPSSLAAGGGASDKKLKLKPITDVTIEPGFIVAMRKINMFSENMPKIITKQDEDLKEVNTLVDSVFSYLDRIKRSNKFNPRSYIDNINKQMTEVIKVFSLESNVLLGFLKIHGFKNA